MDERLFRHWYELRETGSYGLFLTEPSNQLVRLASLFTPSQRTQILKQLQCEFDPAGAEGNVADFVATFVVFEFCQGSDRGDLIADEVVEPDTDYSYDVIDNDFPSGFELSTKAIESMFEKDVDWYSVFVESRASLADLTASSSRYARKILNGTDSLGLARILANTILLADDFGIELAGLLNRSISEGLSPEQAAALVSSADYNVQDISRFERAAEYIAAESYSLPKQCFLDKYQRNSLIGEAEALSALVQQGQSVRSSIAYDQKSMLSVDEMKARYRLMPNSAGIFVPISSHLRVAKSLADAERMACSEKEMMLNMSPREFELFLSKIFLDLGYDVELTKTTRDGGADLVCMRNTHGIPFRIAIEAKRYRDKPINVSLVRSFVGANNQFQANRLVYVTTSRYTSSARDYADKYASHLLTLKEFDQVQEWCSDVLRCPGALI